MKKMMMITAASLLATGVAQAALITWGAETTASADADITTVGTLTYAEDFSTAAEGTLSYTLNGVDFFVASKSDGGNINLNNYGSLETAASHADTFTTISDNYRTLYAGDYYSADNGTSVQLNNLVSGQDYIVQLWSGDDRYGASAHLNVSGGGGATASLQVNIGQWVIGSFTADATTQVLDFGNGGGTVLNAVQVRAVPEPATLGLLGLGAGAMLFLRRFRTR